MNNLPRVVHEAEWPGLKSSQGVCKPAYSVPVPTPEIGRVTSERASSIKSYGDNGIILVLICVAAASQPVVTQ